MRTLTFLLVLFVLFSCQDNNRVDMDKMSRTYVEVMVCKEEYKNYKDSLQVKVNQIYNEMSITEDEFITTLKSYSGDKALWDEFYNKSMAYLDSLRVQNGVKKISTSPKQFEVSHK